MDRNSSPPITSGNIGVALFIGSVALLMLGLQPILLGELVDKHLITMEGVGLVAMGEIVALGLGVALGDALLPVSRYRLIAVAAALLATVFDAATLFATNDGEFLAIRALAGVTTGVMLWTATAIIVRTRTPDRLAAIFMTVQTVTQMGVAMLLARFAVPHGGWQGGFQVLAAIVLFTALPALWLPRRLTPLAPVSGNVEKVTWSMARLLPLAIAFLQMAALGSLWAYLEPVALRVGFDAQGAQSLVSDVLFMQVLGGVTAVWLIRRFHVVFTLGLGSAVLAAVAGSIYLLPAGATSKFSLLCAVFGFTWLFLTPFHIGLALRADGRGRVAMLIPAAQLVGSAFGPLVASFVVGTGNAGPVPLVSLCFAFGAMIVVAFGRKLWTKAEPTAAEAYTGKVVLVAGASSGMGRTFALRLAGEGAFIAVTARRKERLDTLASEIEQRGGRCLALAADAEDPAAAAAVVAACIERFGRIDLALLNAGGAPALDMRKMDASGVTAYMRSNYDTVVNYLFPVMNQMVKQRGGVIAHTNSLAGFLGVPLQGPYSAAKGALRLLFDTCRIEFSHYGIRFVSIYPGFVATEKTANDGMPAPLEISEDEAVDHILRAVRHQRSDYLFPLSMNLMVKLASVLPKPVTNWVLHFDVPRLPEPCDEPSVPR
jgi:NADP-dependent 3-hydroxy acid dehydrogenase YdfG